MTHIIRFIAILFTVLAASYFLPQLYRTSLPASGRVYKEIAYSEILRDFITTEYAYTRNGSNFSAESVRRDRQGKTYTEREAIDLLPLDNVSQLAYEGRFPDTICGLPVTPEQVEAASFTLYYSAGTGNYYDLHELRDRKTYTSASLEPEHLFRINTRGIEFIRCSDNTVDAAKSSLFNESLLRAGFLPPARRVWTPAGKSESEALGYYIVDSKEDFFRLTSDSLRPEVRRLHKPESKISNILFSRTNGFTALLLTEEGATFALLPDDTHIRLALPPLSGQSVTLRGNLLHLTFIYTDTDKQNAYVFDRQFHLLDSAVFPLPPHPEKASIRAASYLFPFTLRQSPWQGFRTEWAPWTRFLWLNICLTLWAAVWRRRKGYSLRTPLVIADLLLVAVFGLYGWLGILIFPLKKTTHELTETPHLQRMD